MRLTADSACRNRGLNALCYLDGTGAAHSGLPVLEYLNHQQCRPRPRDGQTDLGAYEFSAPASSSVRLSRAACLRDLATAGHR